MTPSGPLDWRALFDGIAGTVREGRADARALAILDSRSLVRNMFLASAARSGMLAHLGPGRTLEEVAELAGVTRTDRLRSWLGVGVDLKELVRRDGCYRVKGRRARALAAGDAFLIAHYRSMLEYQVGPYSELDELLRDEAGGGRGDLDRYAEDIAEVSRAATPFVSSLVQRAVSESAPARVLDVGCGTGIYTKIVLDSSQTAHVDGVDLAENVIAAAKVELAPYGGRVTLHADDIVAWLARTPGRFDLIMLANNIYYFDPGFTRGTLARLGRNPQCRWRALGDHDDGPGLGRGIAPRLHVALPVRQRIASRTRRPKGRPCAGWLQRPRRGSPRADRALCRHSGPPQRALALRSTRVLRV